MQELRGFLRFLRRGDCRLRQKNCTTIQDVVVTQSTKGCGVTVGFERAATRASENSLQQEWSCVFLKLLPHPRKTSVTRFVSNSSKMRTVAASLEFCKSAIRSFLSRELVSVRASARPRDRRFLYRIHEEASGVSRASITTICHRAAARGWEGNYMTMGQAPLGANIERQPKMGRAKYFFQTTGSRGAASPPPI